MQDSSPVAFASRTLNTTERNYAQIEKEMLAVSWSLEKFHQYVYGRKITVFSDHKPLEAIKKKPLHKAPKRLQIMLMKTQKYDFDLIYKPGKKIPIPDTLSRAPLEATVKSNNTDEFVLSVNQLPLKGKSLDKIMDESNKDEEILTLKEIILKGWPQCKEVPSTVRTYFDYRDELGIQNGIVVRGDRIVIPRPLRKEMKQKIHTGHQGINSCLKRARELIFWPGMSSEIRQFIGSCHTCLAYSDKPPKEALKWHDVPDRPWQKVGVDIFMLKQGKCYLVTVDYFSQFFEVDFLPNTTSFTVITKLKHHFARYGIPEIVVTGGDTQLKSKEFDEFCREWEIFHKMTSPYNSQSNGQVESAVKIAKRIMKKALASKEDAYLGFLNYRNTPLDKIGKSPAQLLMGKRTRTLIPTTTGLFEPTLNTYKEIKQTKEEKRMQISEKHHRRNELPRMEKGDIVYMSPRFKNEQWKKAVISEVITPRRMKVTTENGSTFVRNKMFLRKSKASEKELTPAVTEHFDDIQSKEPMTKSPPSEETYRTRSGRTVNKPNRLNL